jgi:hypothetical protein
MPLPPPVTSAVLPSSFNMVFSFVIEMDVS